MTISEIKALTYDEARIMAIEETKIKGFDCVFVDLGGGFKYSVLVFKNVKHIYYADDYELHHPGKTKEELHKMYVDMLKNKLFTDEEMLGEIKSYDEYRRKEYFLRNYWIMQFDYVSIFAISEEGKKAVEIGRKTHPYFNPVSFCYVKDKSIVEMSKRVLSHLTNEYIKLGKNLDIFREMIAYELANHEACITCSYDEALNALGLKYNELSSEKREIVRQELNKQINNYSC